VNHPRKKFSIDFSLREKRSGKKPTQARYHKLKGGNEKARMTPDNPLKKNLKKLE